MQYVKTIFFFGDFNLFIIYLQADGVIFLTTFFREQNHQVYNLVVSLAHNESWEVIAAIY